MSENSNFASCKHNVLWGCEHCLLNPVIMVIPFDMNAPWVPQLWFSHHMTTKWLPACDTLNRENVNNNQI